MTTWMKVGAVALAAVVAVFPAFGQVSYAQAAPELVPVLPSGEELEDTTLADVDGEAAPLIPLLPLFGKAVKWVGTVLIAAERLASTGCQKAVHLAGQAAIKAGQVASQAATKVGELTMRGVTVTAVQATQHPLARDTLLGTATGIGGSAITAAVKNEPFTLKDAALGGAIGLGSAAFGHGAARGLEELARRLTGR